MDFESEIANEPLTNLEYGSDFDKLDLETNR